MTENLKVDITDLKARAIKFPDPVKTLILSEPDRLDVDTYLSKMETWERLLKMSNRSD